MNRLSQIAPFTQAGEPSSNDANCGITLQTDSEGCIALNSDWLHVFEQLTRFDNYFLQTRHAYARLLTRTSPLEMQLAPDSEVASDREQRLFLNPNKGHSTYARIARCDCCKSPGRIEFRNRFGMEVMQICSPPEIEAIEWARAIVDCARYPADYRNDRDSYPVIPGDAESTRLRPTVLELLFDEASKCQTGLEITLATTGIVHREIVYPEYTESTDRMLVVHGGMSTLQFGMVAARGIFVSNNREAPRLYVAGPDNAQLLAINPIANAASLGVFRSVVECSSIT